MNSNGSGSCPARPRLVSGWLQRPKQGGPFTHPRPCGLGSPHSADSGTKVPVAGSSLIRVAQDAAGVGAAWSGCFQSSTLPDFSFALDQETADDSTISPVARRIRAIRVEYRLLTESAAASHCASSYRAIPCQHALENLLEIVDSEACLLSIHAVVPSCTCRDAGRRPTSPGAMWGQRILGSKYDTSTTATRWNL